MSTNLIFTEEKIRKLVDEFFETNYSIQEYCYLNDAVDAATLRGWIDEYAPDRPVMPDDPFYGVNVDHSKLPGFTLKRPDAPQGIFARIGDLEILHPVPAAYLKSLIK